MNLVGVGKLGSGFGGIVNQLRKRLDGVVHQPNCGAHPRYRR